MPDLTAFLCGLRPEFAKTTVTYAEVEDKNGALLFKEKEGEGGIPCYEIADELVLGEDEVVELFSSLTETAK